MWLPSSKEIKNISYVGRNTLKYQGTTKKKVKVDIGKYLADSAIPTK